MMRHNGHRAPEEIQAEIERTRHDLDETLSAIERRLTPGQLVDQGLQYLKSSGAKQYLDQLGESVKRDPIPLALVGVGLAWLMVSERRLGHGPTPSAHEAGRSAKEAIDDTKRAVSERTHAARERANEVAQAARERAGRVRGDIEHVIDEQPLALGAVGLAIGALLGGMAPVSERERRIAGDDRDDAARRAERRDDGLDALAPFDTTESALASPADEAPLQPPDEPLPRT